MRHIAASRMKRISSHSVNGHARLTASNSVKHQQRNLLYITEYLPEQAELSVMFYVTENLYPSQVR